MDIVTEKQSQIVKKLKERYHSVPELVFQRSLSRVKNEVELFDVLDTIPQGYPLIWESGERRWKKVTTLFN
jgi:hypothetical protein